MKRDNSTKSSVGAGSLATPFKKLKNREGKSAAALDGLFLAASRLKTDTEVLVAVEEAPHRESSMRV